MNVCALEIWIACQLLIRMWLPPIVESQLWVRLGGEVWSEATSFESGNQVTEAIIYSEFSYSHKQTITEWAKSITKIEDVFCLIKSFMNSKGQCYL